MTFEEYLRYGFVSRLSLLRCGGGPSQSTVNTQNALTQQQLQLGQQQQQQSSEDRARALELEQPLVDQQKALATGDRNAALAASMPTISQISSGYQAAKQSVFNTLPPGAARDVALANLETQKATTIGGTQATAVENAPQILANLGSGYGAFSLQEVGAALSGYGGASSSNQAAGSLQSQQSAAKWGPLTSLAGAAGTAVSGTKLWG